MASEPRANGANPQGDKSKVTDYLRQAAAAVEAGNPVLGVHLYLSAFGFADAQDAVACEDAISGLKRAWSVAYNMKERSLAEYIFEKMEPYLSADELDHCTNQLQELALDRLEEMGIPRDALEGMTNLLSGGLSGFGGLGNLGGAQIMHVSKIPGMPNNLPFDATAVTVQVPGDGGGFADQLAAQGFDFDMSQFDQMAEDSLVEVPAPGVQVDEVPLDVAPEAAAKADAPAAGKLSDGVCDEADGGNGDAHDDAPGDAFGGMRGGATLFAPPPALEEQMGESLEGASPAKQQPQPQPQPQPAAPQEMAASSPEEEIRAALARTAARMVPQAGSDAITRASEKLDYQSIAGYAQVIDNMAAMGIGVADDPDFQALVQVLNTSHGLDRMPAADTLLFRSPAREDAARFVQATLGELGLPVLRMSMEENMQGMPVLCVMATANAAPKMNAAKNNFVAPAVLVVEDLDLWIAPQYDQGEGLEGLVASQLGRGAREAVSLIRNSVENPDVYVLATLSTLGEVDPFFCDLLAPFALVEVENPNDDERFDVWASLVQDHPSLAFIDADQVVRYSANLSRQDMYCAVREAIEEAYKTSLASREYAPVRPENLFEKLSAYQPLESREYQLLEDSVAEMLRSELECSVDEFLGLVEPEVAKEPEALQPVDAGDTDPMAQA